MEKVRTFGGLKLCIIYHIKRCWLTTRRISELISIRLHLFLLHVRFLVALRSRVLESAVCRRRHHHPSTNRLIE